MIRALSLCLICGTVLVAVSCASYPTTPTAPAPLAAVEIFLPDRLSYLSVGRSFSFLAYAVDAEGVYTDVTSKATWVSSDPSIVRVVPERTATITTLALGDVEIFATYQGFSDSIPVFVRSTSSGGSALTLRAAFPGVAQTHQANADFGFQTVTELATWSSSDPGVATVQGGKVTGVAPGTVEISATYSGFRGWYFFSVPPRRDR